MKFDSIGKLVVGLLLILIGGILYLAGNLDFDNFSLNPEVIRADPYVKEIVFDDVGIRQFTTSVVGNCPAGDRECQVNEVFRYVVDNYKYYSDPADIEQIQTPYKTMEVKGGDCEDFSILMNSMLESIGIKTYLVLSDTHAYGLVCGIDPEKLSAYVEESLLQRYAEDEDFDKNGNVVYEDGRVYIKQEYDKEFLIDEYSTYYFGGDGSDIEDPYINQRLEYDITFSSPVDFYVVPGRKDYEVLANGDGFQAYTECTQKNVLRASGECTIGTAGGIAISTGDEDVNAEQKLDIYYLYSSAKLLEDVNIVSYELKNQTCVVLDGTSGKFGYPGFNPPDLEGRRKAVDPKTKEIFYLS